VGKSNKSFYKKGVMHHANVYHKKNHTNEETKYKFRLTLILINSEEGRGT
jgi:hypothetical protein